MTIVILIDLNSRHHRDSPWVTAFEFWRLAPTIQTFFTFFETLGNIFVSYYFVRQRALLLFRRSRRAFFAVFFGVNLSQSVFTCGGPAWKNGLPSNQRLVDVTLWKRKRIRQWRHSRSHKLVSRVHQKHWLQTHDIKHIPIKLTNKLSLHGFKLCKW